MHVKMRTSGACKNVYIPLPRAAGARRNAYILIPRSFATTTNAYMLSSLLGTRYLVPGAQYQVPDKTDLVKAALGLAPCIRRLIRDLHASK